MVKEIKEKYITSNITETTYSNDLILRNEKGIIHKIYLKDKLIKTFFIEDFRNNEHFEESSHKYILSYGTWVCTDPSCNQYRKDIDDNTFIFKEDRIINPETNEIKTYESEICLTDYSQEEMFADVQPYGYSFHEMCCWLEEGKNLDLIAECIFEMEIN